MSVCKSIRKSVYFIKSSYRRIDKKRRGKKEGKRERGKLRHVFTISQKCKLLFVSNKDDYGSDDSSDDGSEGSDDGSDNNNSNNDRKRRKRQQRLPYIHPQMLP